MKKITILLAFLLSGVISYSQDNTIRLKTFKNCLGYWNSSSEQYDFQDYAYAGITFTFKDDYISADDQSRSIYRIIEDLPTKKDRNKETTSASCLDEKNRKCIVAIMSYRDKTMNSSIAVIYEDFMYIYIIDNQ